MDYVTIIEGLMQQLKDKDLKLINREQEYLLYEALLQSKNEEIAKLKAELEDHNEPVVSFKEQLKNDICNLLESFFFEPKDKRLCEQINMSLSAMLRDKRNRRECYAYSVDAQINPHRCWVEVTVFCQQFACSKIEPLKFTLN